METNSTAQATTIAGVPKSLLGEIIRFAVIGGINTGIDFAILNILMAVTGINEGTKLIPLNIISFTVAVINSYFLNKRWAFKDNSQGNNSKKFSIFLVVSLIGVAINTGALTLITGNIDPMFGLSKQLWANVAKIVATGLSLVWNFIGYKLIVFKKSQ